MPGWLCSPFFFFPFCCCCCNVFALGEIGYFLKQGKSNSGYRSPPSKDRCNVELHHDHDRGHCRSSTPALAGWVMMTPFQVLKIVGFSYFSILSPTAFLLSVLIRNHHSCHSLSWLLLFSFQSQQYLTHFGWIIPAFILDLRIFLQNNTQGSSFRRQDKVFFCSKACSGFLAEKLQSSEWPPSQQGLALWPLWPPVTLLLTQLPPAAEASALRGDYCQLWPLLPSAASPWGQAWFTSSHS